MATTTELIDAVHARLKTRGDTFLDSDGEALFAELKRIAGKDSEAAQAVKEIEHRRSEHVE
jgi:dephospho-CoA kinase